MKILIVLGRYLPDKSAGIENYCHYLSKLLFANGHFVEVAILESPKTEPYVYEQVKVILLKNGFESFVNLIQQQNYDICHFHEYSAFGGIEMFWIKEARLHCKIIYFTFHLPYFTCYKNDFRFNGVEDCNIFSSPARCVKCLIATKLHYSEEPSLLNTGIQWLTPLLLKTNKIKELRENVELNTNRLNELLHVCNGVLVIARWFKKLLSDNGYNSEKICLIPPILNFPGNVVQSGNEIKRRLLFVGRIEKQKGLHLLCKAMNHISTKSIELDVFGNIVDQPYYSECKKEYEFNYKGSISREELLLKLPEYDFLVLPSVFTEMYSMILQESINAQLPVIASSAKGNVDQIRDNQNGFIFNYNDSEHLAVVIDKAYDLLGNGWRPVFKTSKASQNYREEILSYYT